MIIPSSVIDSFTRQWAPLSNFYPVKIEFEGIEYPSVEHAFQAAKTYNESTRRAIAGLKSAGAAKRAGREMGVMVPHWTEYARFAVMEQLIETKFSSANPDMVSTLLATGDALLIEGNYWHDNTWGSCFCTRVSCRRTGANALGRILMKRRAQL